LPVCPKCHASFSYAEDHVCEGRDRSKLLLLASVVAGALAGAPLGRMYGISLVDEVCSRPGAGNLCWLTSVADVPVYMLLGAVFGASVAALVIVMILGRRQVAIDGMR